MIASQFGFKSDVSGYYVYTSQTMKNILKKKIVLLLCCIFRHLTISYGTNYKWRVPQGEINALFSL